MKNNQAQFSFKTSKFKKVSQHKGGITKNIARPQQAANPEYSANHIIQTKGHQVHMPGTSGKRSEGTHKGNKTCNQDSLAAMLHKIMIGFDYIFRLEK